MPRGIALRRAVALLATSGIAAAGLALGPAATGALADPAPKRIVSGWMPYWMTSPAHPAGINSAVQNADLFVDVSPFWYSATAKSGGGVQVRLNPNFTNGAANVGWAMGQLTSAGLTVLPSIADGSGKGRMAAALKDPALRAQHVQDIVSLVTSGGYGGIDLDYETFAFTDGSSSWAETQPNWTAFITELAAALHAQGKLLSVTIPPPCSTAGACGPQGGYWVYNMTGIAPAADRIRIMAYDYHVNGIGPIAPMPWVRSLVTYAASVVDPAKLQIGVPTYGRAWTKKGSNGSYKLSGNCPAASTSAYNSLTSMASVTDADIPGLLAAQGVDPASIQWSEADQESWVEYDKKVTWTDGSGAQQVCTAKRIMWWVDPRGVLARTQLVGEFGLSAAAYWTVGGDNPEQWPAIRAYAVSLAPAGTDVAATAPAAVVAGQPIALTATASTAGAPLAGVPATAQFKADGAKDFADVASGTTAADGTVVFSVPGTVSGEWQVLVPGADGRAAGTSAPVRVDVVGIVSARSKSATVGRGTQIKVRAMLQPARAGQKATLQVQVGQGWKPMARGKADAKGRVLLVVKAPAAKGRYAYRVVSAPAGGIREGVSAELPIRVR